MAEGERGERKEREGREQGQNKGQIGSTMTVRVDTNTK